MKNSIVRFVCISIVAATFAGVALHQLGYPQYGIDDANIFFVYAKNLIDGHGIVYNIGGERVEGVTSLLWMLICAGVFALASSPETALFIFNVIVLALSLTCVTYYLDGLFNWKSRSSLDIMSSYSLLYVLLVCSSPDYMTWMTVTLMDTGLWGALLSINTVMVLRFNPQTPSKSFTRGFFAGNVLMLLARPEAMLWSIVFIAVVWGRVCVASGPSKATRTALPFAAGYCGVLSALTLFRLVYFNYPLPNTYYAKVSPSLSYNLTQGLLYVRDYCMSSVLVLMCIACFVLFFGIACVTILKAVIKAQRPLLGYHFLVFIVFTGLCVPVLTGGDHFELFRFYQPVFPLLVLSAFVVCAYPAGTSIFGKCVTASRMPGKIIIPLALLFVVLGQAYCWTGLSAPDCMKNEFQHARKWRDMGSFLSGFWENVQSYPSAGCILAGGVQLKYRGDIIDLMGLNNTTMAHADGMREGIKNHAAFERAGFYELQPDLVLPYYIPEFDCDTHTIALYMSSVSNVWVQMALKNIWDDAEFRKRYDFVKIARSDASGEQCFYGFISKPFLESLQGNASYAVTFLQYYDDPKG